MTAVQREIRKCKERGYFLDRRNAEENLQVIKEGPVLGVMKFRAPLWHSRCAEFMRWVRASLALQRLLPTQWITMHT